MEAIARQPEASGKIQGAMLVIAALYGSSCAVCVGYLPLDFA